MLAIPPVLLQLLGLEPGSEVSLTERHGRLVIEPRPRPRYTLDELLNQCDPGAPVTDEDRGWTGGAPAGREIL